MAAASGSPSLLRESDIGTEDPDDVDDENLTEQRFSPCVPGELSKVPSALALFKICRILSRALDQLLPSSASYEFSINNLKSISDELDHWWQSTPTHLRMKFSNDRPSTEVISDRSPFLSLAYFFIRNIIHRPLVCYGGGSSVSASLITIADSAKHIVQIIDLLEERKMNYAFPMNKTELLLAAGFSLLWQCSELSQDSKLAKDNQKSLDAVTELLMRDSPSVANEFQRVACAFVPTQVLPPSLIRSPPQTILNLVSDRNSAQSPSHMIPNFVSDRSSMAPPSSKPKSARRQLRAIASRLSSLTKPHQPRAEDTARRATVPRDGASYQRPDDASSSQLSISSSRSLPVFSIRSPPPTHAFMDLPASAVNLDYLPLGADPLPTYPNLPRKDAVACPDVPSAPNIKGMGSSNPATYEGLYNGIFQEQILQARLDLDVGSLTNPSGWVEQQWPVCASSFSGNGAAPKSVLSVSEGSTTSAGVELGGGGGGSNNGSTASRSMDHLDVGSKIFQGIPVPVSGENPIRFHGFGPST